MPYKRYKRRAVRRYRPKRKYARKHKMITGNSGISAPMRMWNAGAGIVKTVGSLVKSVQGIRSLINVEQKYTDVHDSQKIYNTGTSYTNISSANHYLTDTGQGSTDTQRTGDSILAKRFFMNYSITKDPNATGTMARFAVVVNKDPDATSTNYADYADQTTGTVWMRQKDPTSGKDPGNLITLCQRSFSFDNNKPVIQGKIYCPLNFHVKYNGPNYNQNAAEKNAIDLLWSSNEPINAPTLRFDSRVEYVDN